MQNEIVDPPLSSLLQSVRVAVFAEGAAAQEALDAGADIVGGDDLVALVKESERSKIDSNLL